MNLLCLCNASTALEIIKTIKCDTYHIICPKKEHLEHVKLPAGHALAKDIFLYSHKAMKKGRALKGVKWNKLIPLSSHVLTNMFECETETMKMLERVGKIGTHLYDNRKKMFMNHLRFWNHVLDVKKIDVFYRCAPPHEGYDNIIYHLCLLKKIPVFMFYGFHPGKAYLAHNVLDPLPDFMQRLSEERESCMELTEDKIIMLPEIRDYAERHWNKLPPVLPPVVVPAKKVKTQKNLLKIHADLLKFYASQCVKPDYTKPYIYMPLHFQYEATTCPMARVFVDQILIAEILSRMGITIYVKEHPRMSKNRNMDYYKKLISLPHVKLISTKENTYTLVDNCFATATATGTAGWEAVLRGKPVLMFGYNFYQYAPGVWHVGSVEDCLKAKKEIAAFQPDKKELMLFLKTLCSYLFKHDVINIVKNLNIEIKKYMVEKGGSL